VAQQPCFLCAWRSADAHAIRFTPHPLFPGFFTDEYMVPLCRAHHRKLHRVGNEMAWWRARLATYDHDPTRDPVAKARELWRASHATNTEQPPPRGEGGGPNAIEASRPAVEAQ
jgi:hypothetical protein